jgi:NitT/TauT family transport system permease protein
MMRKSALRRALPWLVIAGMFLVWEALCRLFSVP